MDEKENKNDSNLIISIKGSDSEDENKSQTDEEYLKVDPVSDVVNGINTTKRAESSFKDIQKKKFRLSEFLAEKIITGIAFLCIAIIILIFIFVFRESLPIFSPGKTSAENMKPVNGPKPEQYTPQTGSNSIITSSDNRNSVKNTDSEVSEEKPETYGSTTEKPERYGIEYDKNNDEHSGTSSLDQGKNASLNNESSGTEGKADLKSLTGTEWMPVSDNPRYGLLALFLGTFKLSMIAILIAAPFGILAALFSAAFAPRWLREIIKPGIEILAGFPSVVIGFFALMVMATFFQDLFGYGSRLNAFVGGVAMSLAAIPIIFTITEDALAAVPQTYKEASLALGASKWQTAFYVTLPAATPGVFAAVLLGIGRVFGETMIALMATGNAALFSMNPFESIRTLSATIGAEMAEVVFGDTHYNVLFLIGSLLFIFTFILNVIAEFYVKGKLMKRFQGSIS